MATPEPPVERFYDPDRLDPDAPRLYVWRNGDTWELLDKCAQGAEHPCGAA